MDLYLIAQHSTNYRTYKALNLKDMAIMLSVSVRTPIKYLRYACPSLYGFKLNRTTFDKPIVNIKL